MQYYSHPRDTYMALYSLVQDPEVKIKMWQKHYFFIADSPTVIIEEQECIPVGCVPTIVMAVWEQRPPSETTDPPPEGSSNMGPDRK